MTSNKKSIALIVILFLILTVAFTANGLYQRTARELTDAKQRILMLKQGTTKTASSANPQDGISAMTKEKEARDRSRLEGLLYMSQDSSQQAAIAVFDALQFVATRHIEDATTTDEGTWAIVSRDNREDEEL